MKWVVLHVKPRCEKKLAEHCVQHRVSYYLPLREEVKIYQRRKVAVQKPLFPGYLFTSLDDESRLLLQKTNNILRILEPGNTRELLHELAQVRRALEIDPKLEAFRGLKRGTNVRIRGGPFMGVEGTVASFKGTAKVCLNVQLIGQAVVVEVDREFLEVID